MLQLILAVVFMSASEVTAGFNFTQNSFELIYERLELVRFSHEYFESATIKTFKHNRTQAATNATFVIKKNVNSDLKIQFEAFKFASNEYRDFPILFSYNFCECLAHNDFGSRRLLACGNFTIRNCSVQKGIHHICNFFPDAERFPPYIPEGSYRLDIKWFVGPKETLFIQGYGTIKNKFFWDR